jgi:hypothetical protein
MAIEASVNLIKADVAMRVIKRDDKFILLLLLINSIDLLDAVWNSIHSQ